MKKNSPFIRLAIVDDHSVVRAALVTLLESDGRFEVVAQGGDAASVSAFVRRNDIDLLLLDLDLGGANPLREVETANGRPRICILSHHLDPHFVKESIRAGAAGYVSKHAAPEELLKAVREINAGDSYYSGDVRSVALSFAFSGLGRQLTDREREVLRWAAEGVSSSEIAGRLFISRRTVESHRASMMKKLGLKTQTDLVRYAIRQGFISA